MALLGPAFDLITNASRNLHKDRLIDQANLTAISVDDSSSATITMNIFTIPSSMKPNATCRDDIETI